MYTQYSGTNRLFTISPDGSGQPESLITRPNPIFESSPTPDGRAVVFREISEQRNRDIWIRITSYNVCYTKLLRPNRLMRAF